MQARPAAVKAAPWLASLLLHAVVLGPFLSLLPPRATPVTTGFDVDIVDHTRYNFPSPRPPPATVDALALEVPHRFLRGFDIQAGRRRAEPDCCDIESAGQTGVVIARVP